MNVMYSTLKPLYKCSRALIIGINKYQKVSPLSYAIHDAKGIKVMRNSLHKSCKLGFSYPYLIALSLSYHKLALVIR